jgi:hypothetical protein
MSFRVSSIPQRVADEVRATMRSPGYGHPAHREVAKGTGPCRACLRPFQVGVDERILFTYQPFSDEVLPSPGPVFIHAEPCDRYEGSRVPDELRVIPLVVEGFDSTGRSLGRYPVAGHGPEAAMTRMLFETGAEYLHLRHAQAGCFVARVDPAPVHQAV